MTMRELPHNRDAERVLLSCCLIDGSESLSMTINRGITAQMFYDPKHAIVYGKMVDMLSEAKSIDIQTLAQELSLTKQFELIGGYPFMMEISNAAPTTLRVGYFADRIREFHTLRQAIREANALVESCYSYTGTGLDSVLDAPVSRLMSLACGAQDVAEPEWAQVVDEAGKVLESVISNTGLPENLIIPFPWKCMNDAFTPMQRGQLVEIAARPSIGKSSLARPLAVHAAKTGRKVYFVTLEVNPVNVALQMAASISRVGIRQVAKAHVKDQQSLKEAIFGLRAYGITISRKDRSIARILARARALHAKGALDMLVIDHGLLVEDVAGARSDDLKLAIGRLTKGLKALAQELNIVCVLLWQLNRASVKDGNREPNMTDLKDCGSLEEDADKILFIHRPTKDGLTGFDQRENATADDQPRYYQNVIQAKGRDDGTSILSFYFERTTATFIPASASDRQTQ